MTSVDFGDELEIRRAKSDVFNFVADHEHLPAWTVGIKRVSRTTPGSIGVGTTYRVVGKMLGRTLESTYEVTAYEPETTFSGRLESPLFRLEETYRFEDEDGLTTVVLTASAHAHGRLKWMGPLWGVAVQRQIRADHRRLKSILEKPRRRPKPARAPAPSSGASPAEAEEEPATEG